MLYGDVAFTTCWIDWDRKNLVNCPVTALQWGTDWFWSLRLGTPRVSFMKIQVLTSLQARSVWGRNPRWLAPSLYDILDNSLHADSTDPAKNTILSPLLTGKGNPCRKPAKKFNPEDFKDVYNLKGKPVYSEGSSVDSWKTTWMNFMTTI